MSTKKQILYTAAVVGAFILLIGGIKVVQVRRAIAAQADFGPAPEAVTSIVVQEHEWPRTLNAVGSLNARQGVTLSAQEAGMVTKILFESGDRVEQGKLLVEIDTSVEEAALVGARATAKEAAAAFERIAQLRPTRAMSPSDYDRAEAKAGEAAAQVESLEATIARKKVIAPFDGYVGIRMVNVGQYLSPGTSVVPLYSLNPLYVDFSVPQQAAPNISQGLKIEVRIDAFSDQVFEGTLTGINPQVDPSTRNVLLQGTLSNEGEKLKPGMFADVTLVLPQTDHFLTVPAPSVNSAPYGSMVYIIEEMKDPSGKTYRGVRQQIVKVGKRRGDQLAITEGLRAGEEVVTSGVFKLRPGLAVHVDNSFAPSNEAAPKPADS